MSGEAFWRVWVGCKVVCGGLWMLVVWFFLCVVGLDGERLCLCMNVNLFRRKGLYISKNIVAFFPVLAKFGTAHTRGTGYHGSELEEPLYHGTFCEDEESECFNPPLIIVKVQSSTFLVDQGLCVAWFCCVHLLSNQQDMPCTSAHRSRSVSPTLIEP